MQLWGKSEQLLSDIFIICEFQLSIWSPPPMKLNNRELESYVLEIFLHSWIFNTELI